MRIHLSALVLGTALATPLGVPSAPLRVELPGKTVSLSSEVLRKLPSDTISFSAHNAPAVRFRGVKLIDVFAAAGLPVDSMRTGRDAWAVVATASDGYHALFSAAELDPKLGPTTVWLAFERDGAPLDAKEAPYRLVVPTDKKPSRAAHMVTTISALKIMSGNATPDHKH